MGDQHITRWVQTLVETVPLRGPVLEVGSRREPESPNFFDYREFFPDGTAYLGIDLQDGLGVDAVCDLTQGEQKPRLGPYAAFQTILSTCTLEHVGRPWILADRLTALLAPDGYLVVSAPFSWVLHGHPDDYFRYSPSGIQQLFPTIRFNRALSTLTTASGRAVSLDDESAEDRLRFGGVILGSAMGERARSLGPCVLIQQWSFMLEGVNVNMIGQRNGHA